TPSEAEGSSASSSGGSCSDSICSGRLTFRAVTVLMDGKALAERVRGEVAQDVERLARPVGLATVLVGEDPASEIYIKRKQEACREVGIEPFDHTLSAETTEPELLRLSGDLTAEERVTGILCRLPLPEQIDEDRIIRSIAPIKDVDGFHPFSA